MYSGVLVGFKFRTVARSGELIQLSIFHPHLNHKCTFTILKSFQIKSLEYNTNMVNIQGLLT